MGFVSAGKILYFVLLHTYPLHTVCCLGIFTARCCCMKHTIFACPDLNSAIRSLGASLYTRLTATMIQIDSQHHQVFAGMLHFRMHCHKYFWGSTGDPNCLCGVSNSFGFVSLAKACAACPGALSYTALIMHSRLISATTTLNCDTPNVTSTAVHCHVSFSTRSKFFFCPRVLLGESCSGRKHSIGRSCGSYILPPIWNSFSFSRGNYPRTCYLK